MTAEDTTGQGAALEPISPVHRSVLNGALIPPDSDDYIFCKNIKRIGELYKQRKAAPKEDKTGREVLHLGLLELFDDIDLALLDIDALEVERDRCKKRHGRMVQILQTLMSKLEIEATGGDDDPAANAKRVRLATTVQDLEKMQKEAEAAEAALALARTRRIVIFGDEEFAAMRFKWLVKLKSLIMATSPTGTSSPPRSKKRNIEEDYGKTSPPKKMKLTVRSSSTSSQRPTSRGRDANDRNPKKLKLPMRPASSSQQPDNHAQNDNDRKSFIDKKPKQKESGRNNSEREMSPAEWWESLPQGNPDRSYLMNMKFLQAFIERAEQDPVRNANGDFYDV